MCRLVEQVAVTGFAVGFDLDHTRLYREAWHETRPGQRGDFVRNACAVEETDNRLSRRQPAGLTPVAGRKAQSPSTSGMV